MSMHRSFACPQEVGTYEIYRMYHEEMDWNDVQKEVWRERFFNETPSKVLAIRFHVRNTWIDNTYSRLNKQFRIAVKTWWNNNN